MATDRDSMLEGLEDLRPDSTPIERAAAEQLRRLAETGALDDSHRILVELVKDLARSVGVSARQGKGAAMALASKELREALAMLPTPPGPADAWSQLREQLERDRAGS